MAERTTVVGERGIDLGDNILARQFALALIFQEPAFVSICERVVFRVYMYTNVVLLRIELPGSGGAEPACDMCTFGRAGTRDVEVAPVCLDISMCLYVVLT